MAIEGISAPAVQQGFFEKAGASIDRLNTRIWEAASSTIDPLNTRIWEAASSTADKVSPAANLIVNNRIKIAGIVAFSIAAMASLWYYVDLSSTYSTNIYKVDNFFRSSDSNSSVCSYTNFFQTALNYRCPTEDADSCYITEGETCLKSLPENIRQTIMRINSVFVCIRWNQLNNVLTLLQTAEILYDPIPISFKQPLTTDAQQKTLTRVTYTQGNGFVAQFLPKAGSGLRPLDLVSYLVAFRHP